MPLAMRRLCLVLLPALGVFWHAALQAQSWPSRPVRLIIGFTAGGTTDVLARQVASQLTEKLKQPFIIENKPGAGGNIGTEYVLRAVPDGYTMLVASVGPIAVNPTLYGKLPYNPLTDLIPVIQLADVPNVLVVPPSLPVRTLEEFIAWGRANPGKLSYASTGVGTSSHLSSFMFSKQAGFDAVHLPYKGADALQDLMAGRSQFMFATIPSVVSLIKAGRLRAIAVSSAKRSRSMPDIPTVAEKVFPGFEAGSWFGIFAPKGTPEAIVTAFNKAVFDALQVPAVESQMIQQGADPAGGPPARFSTFVQKESEKWRTIVRESGAVAE